MTFWWTWDRFLQALIAGLTLATIGSFFGGQAWWLDVLSDFKTQLFTGAALLLFSSLVRWRKKEVALTLLLLVINGATLAPFLGMLSEERAATKIIAFNIYHKNLNTTPTLEFLRNENADLVVVTEVTEKWQKALEELSSIYPHRFFGPNYQEPGSNPHKIGILAKRAWKETGVEWSEVTSRAFSIWVRFSSDSSKLTVAGVHLLNPVAWPASHQRAEADALASMVKNFDGPVVVAGDFNMTPFSTRYGTMLQKSNLRRAKGGLNPTWPALLAYLGLSLDHLLVGTGIDDAVMRTGPQLGSDHLPVIGTFKSGK